MAKRIILMRHASLVLSEVLLLVEILSSIFFGLLSRICREQLFLHLFWYAKASRCPGHGEKGVDERSCSSFSEKKVGMAFDEDFDGSARDSD